MHHLTTTPGIYAITGLAAWLLGCLFWLAAGIASLAETIRNRRARRNQ